MAVFVFKDIFSEGVFDGPKIFLGSIAIVAGLLPLSIYKRYKKKSKNSESAPALLSNYSHTQRGISSVERASLAEKKGLVNDIRAYLNNRKTYVPDRGAIHIGYNKGRLFAEGLLPTIFVAFSLSYLLLSPFFQSFEKTRDNYILVSIFLVFGLLLTVSALIYSYKKFFDNIPPITLTDSKMVVRNITEKEFPYHHIEEVKLQNGGLKIQTNGVSTRIGLFAVDVSSTALERILQERKISTTEPITSIFERTSAGDKVSQYRFNLGAFTAPLIAMTFLISSGVVGGPKALVDDPLGAVKLTLDDWFFPFVTALLASLFFVGISIAALSAAHKKVDEARYGKLAQYSHVTGTLGFYIATFMWFVAIQNLG